ncbi:MAG: carbon storage regulator [Candidatus Nealsonbacteria bacterium]|nr:carbon storage regulator [Candidatus Nealsonbacteria bacterium]
MLILSRRAGESIQIGGTIEVTVLETRKGRAKLGLSGPANAPIRRKEACPRNSTSFHQAGPESSALPPVREVFCSS